ncbi:MAG: hypothetical protein JNN07_11130 [Verrucomicrobiales bacterium]|nr:hypothetical protein [Verrucomicrobiales bacterium]
MTIYLARPGRCSSAWYCFRLLLSLGLFLKAETTQARTGSADWTVPLYRSRQIVGSSLQSIGLLGRPDGSITILVNSGMAGREGVLARYDSEGVPVATNLIEGYIREGQLDREGNLVLIQWIQNTTGSREARAYVSKLSPAGQLIWRSESLPAVSPQISGIDAKGNVWIVESSLLSTKRFVRVFYLDRTGKLTWTRDFELGGLLRADTHTAFKDLSVDAEGNGILVQVEAPEKDPGEIVHLALRKLSPHGEVIWTVKEDVQQFSFLSLPIVPSNPEIGQVQVRTDAQNRVVLAGSSWHWSRIGIIRGYATTPRTFLVGYTADGGRRWMTSSSGETWEQDSLLAIDPAGQIVVCKASDRQLITSSYSADGVLAWTKEYDLDPGSRPRVEPQLLSLDAQNNPLIYYLTTSGGLGVNSGPYDHRTGLLKLTAAGQFAWHLPVTNISAVDYGINGYALPVVKVESDGQVRTLGNPQPNAESGLALDVGSVTSAGNPGNFFRARVKPSFRQNPPFDLWVDCAQNGFIGAGEVDWFSGNGNLTVTKFFPTGARAWEIAWPVEGAQTGRPEAMVMKVSPSGVAALGYLTTDAALNVRVAKPDGTAWASLRFPSGFLLAVEDNGAVSIGTPEGEGVNPLTRVARWSVDGRQAWAADIPADRSLIQVFEGPEDTRLILWQRHDSLKSTVQSVDSVGRLEWRMDLDMGGTSAMSDGKNATYFTGTSVSTVPGEVTSTLTMQIDVRGQMISSNRIYVATTELSQAASDQGKLFRPACGGGVPVWAVYYEPDSARASQMVQEGRWLLYEDDRQYSTYPLINRTLRVADAYTTGPIFVGLNQAYCLAHWADDGLEGWDLLSLRFSDGLEWSPSMTKVFGTGIPGDTYRLERTSNLWSPWETKTRMKSDAQGDLFYFETPGGASNAFFRFVPE